VFFVVLLLTFLKQQIYYNVPALLRDVVASVICGGYVSRARAISPS